MSESPSALIRTLRAEIELLRERGAACEQLLRERDTARIERDAARELLGQSSMPARVLKVLKTVTEVPYETARRWLEQGLIEGERRGGRWFYSEASLQAFLRRWRV
jgi:hypothetical protein